MGFFYTGFYSFILFFTLILHTSEEWKDKNPNIERNIRDYAYLKKFIHFMKFKNTKT